MSHTWKRKILHTQKGSTKIPEVINPYALWPFFALCFFSSQVILAMIFDQHHFLIITILFSSVSGKAFQSHLYYGQLTWKKLIYFGNTAQTLTKKSNWDFSIIQYKFIEHWLCEQCKVLMLMHITFKWEKTPKKKKIVCQMAICAIWKQSRVRWMEIARGT